MKAITKRNGLLTINGIEYQTKISDLEDLGELGNGTSGHVVKMKPKQTDAIIAVKVLINIHRRPLTLNVFIFIMFS